MSLKTACPACGKSIRYAAEHAGRAARCPACSNRVELPAAADEPDLNNLAVGPPVEARQPVGHPAPVLQSATRRAAAPPRHARPWFRTPNQWTAWDTLTFRTGVGCILFGIAALVLPQFGLQMRKLNNLGAAGASAAGWGLIGFGTFLIAYVALFKGRMLRLTLYGAGLAILAFAALLGWGWYQSNRAPMRPFPTAAMTHAPPSPTNAPRGLQARPEVTTNAAAFPHASPPSHAPPPHTPLRPPAPVPLSEAYEQMCREYGKNHVARVTFTNADGPELTAHVRVVKTALIKSGKSQWRISTMDDLPNLLIAPMDDLDVFVRNLDLGPAEIDHAERRLRIDVDRQRLKK